MEKKLKIPSTMDSLHKIEKVVDEISTEYKINSEIYGNVLIATLEAANNAILHGNKLDDKKEVDVSFNIENNVLHLTVIDQGPGFDYENIPDPTSPENLEKVNGRGVFLMEKLSDKIEFSDEGKKVELFFNL